MRVDLRGLAAVATTAIAGGWCVADEILLRNDSLMDGGSVSICPCFGVGEEAAVWLTSPCDGDIVGIQIFWKSFLGGADVVVAESILVYEGGAFPRPGPLKKELLAPALTDGFLNEYRYEDENQTIPIRIPVTAGEEFAVALKFFEANNGSALNPSIVSDADGCQPGKNAVKVNDAVWTNACSLGVTGDWVIRAIVDCTAAPTGACCLPDGGCDQRTEADCVFADGAWNGAGTDCADVECLGACFVPTTGACVQLDKATCDAVAGLWQGPGTDSCQNPCPADLDGDGDLDFFDVSAFLQLFNMNDPAADLDDDGDHDFFDISAYIQSFNAGCP